MPSAAAVVEQPGHLPPQVGDRVGLLEVERDRPARALRELPHPAERRGHVGVVERGLEHAVAGGSERVAQRHDLGLVGVGAGHQLAVGRSVQRRARRRHAEAAGEERVAGEPLHRREVVGGGRLVGRAAVAHHVGPQRTVRHLAAHVHHPAAPVERVEVPLVALPLPLDALGQRRTGDVLHALHQPDQPVVAVGGGRREADPAVAHHHGGDAVPARRRELRIPGGLRVVVGVHVDPAGRHHQAVGVELAAAAADVAPDLGDPVTVQRDVGDERVAARPVDHQTAPHHHVVRAHAGNATTPMSTVPRRGAPGDL